MGYNSFLKSPKKEEQQVPDTAHEFCNTVHGETDDVMNELEGLLGIENDFEHDKLLSTDHHIHHYHHHINPLQLYHHYQQQLSWDFIDWEDFPNGTEEEEEEEDEEDELDEEREQKVKGCPLGNELMLFGGEENVSPGGCHNYSADNNDGNLKKEETGFWDEKKKVALNLNLNYQEVLDAWSDRGPLWADTASSLSMATNYGYYMGEVPVMEEDRARREASVLRYKEKRQSRLFSKKIRYQVRKLNADKRPRLKGRFVKRVS
ncbi:zinc finger protein CONSTANS-LIKE 8 [Carica papaya]|uniref:zinc finger protein CONSTANS-LIKE 8 n=1 Tax=Carica papaya TaxID=3649 RepID=UPI000B8CB707|nr:zinc finger protein CONSTANS-LIKE 8 [Carica papaya]